MHALTLREDLIFCIVQESALILKELKEALWIGRSTRSKREHDYDEDYDEDDYGDEDYEND